jgi:crotonobetainyl-CoA:carnitine CoA-transferase CaiB-like acyl-CoA transferase
MGVLTGTTVLDLSWGIAGPMTTMLLADQGAKVTKIEPPSGDPFSGQSGYTVWQRGKRNAQLDLRDPEDLAVFRVLVERADVLVESFSPGTTERLGIDYATVQDINPRLVYCSITGYGSTGPLAERPAYDGLVAARTGQQWEARGVVGGTLARLAGRDDPLGGLEAPEGCWVGAPRPGPLFGGLPWVDLGAFYLATLGISAALRAREVTGDGQHVETSLLQGAMATAVWPWQRVENVDAPGFQSWVIDPRAPKGFFQCADGRWIHQWVPLPSFVLGAAASGRLEVTDELTSPRKAAVRIALDPHEMILLHEYIPKMAQEVARFDSKEWIDLAADVGVPLQPVRTPEEALDDPLLLEDGCVVELPGPDGEVLRQVGQVYSLSACPSTVAQGVARPGADTAAVRAEALRPVEGMPPPSEDVRSIDSPLQAITVLDLGLAAAGPFGAQLLADLGATVIKINQSSDGYWFSNHIGMGCNRGKRSIAIDLKSEEGKKVLYDLIARADVVHHNMRYEAAQRLGVDYETVRELNPRLVYCHTRGYERGPRDGLPGNDQTAAALAGVEWLDGGLDDGGAPIWSSTSLGDTGNGLLSAIAVVQALLHRDRTGEGQFVDTSIMYAHLLHASSAWKAPDGRVAGARQKLDAMQLGWGPLYRLYATADEGWLCVAVVDDRQFAALCEAIGSPGLQEDARFATAAARADNAKELASILEQIFLGENAETWFDRLDQRGVPCETTHEDRVAELFDSPELRDKGWIATYQHPVVGQIEVAGRLIDFSRTPGPLAGPPPMVGQHTREILEELGYDTAAVDRLVLQGSVAVWDS